MSAGALDLYSAFPAFPPLAASPPDDAHTPPRLARGPREGHTGTRTGTGRMDGVHNLPPELTGCRETRGAIVNEFDQNGRKAHRAAPGCAPRTGFVRDMLDMWRNVSGRCLAVSRSRGLAVSRSRGLATQPHVFVSNLPNRESGIGNQSPFEGWMDGWIVGRDSYPLDDRQSSHDDNLPFVSYHTVV